MTLLLYVSLLRLKKCLETGRVSWQLDMQESLYLFGYLRNCAAWWIMRCRISMELVKIFCVMTFREKKSCGQYWYPSRTENNHPNNV
jgi:hypothetical protein